MEILPLAYYENLKRFLRRRKYQRLNSTLSSSSSSPTHQLNKKKLKISRLGGCRINSTRRLWRIRRRTPKLHFKIVSTPIKYLAKFHDKYVDIMISVAKKVVNPNSIGGFLGGRRAAKARHFALVSSSEEVVDSRLVMEMYKKLTASRQLSSGDELL
ncbi:hypothetical protein Patl1_15088 [Pistacia atlantica]|uniref:Uncharacterized protein n=1 Tax=Pistacia atlantica TaxID=434234 RepID=A0ACC1B7M9_9ROSI|nr:hypothetical protein Patl1_15088 [Pistacia atlantica]